MKRRQGRPRFEPTDAQKLQVTTLAGNGFPDSMIAEHLKINGKTLVKYFAEELRVSKRVAAAKLKLTIYQRGMKGELVAALAWLNNHGWGNDNPDGELLPSPNPLKISFEDGAPGRPGHDAVASGAVRIGEPIIDVPATTSTPAEPVVLTEQQFKTIERESKPAPSQSSPLIQLWERLAMTSEELARANGQPEQDWGAQEATLARARRVWGGSGSGGF
ncbi:MAG: hypothetical protein ACLQT5_01185 [Steroidobacteraceae bacterium]